MSLGIVWLDQIMSILLTMSKHCLQFLLLCVVFTNAEHNSIKLKLYNNWSVQAVNGILECAMWKLKEPIKFAHL